MMECLEEAKQGSRKGRQVCNFVLYSTCKKPVRIEGCESIIGRQFCMGATAVHPLKVQGCRAATEPSAADVCLTCVKDQR